MFSKPRLWMALGMMILGLAAGCAAAETATPAPTQAALATTTVQTAPPPATAAPTTAAPTISATSTAQQVVPSTGGSLRYDLIADQSEARYRVREQLANVDLPNDAIGSTKEVTGSIVLLGDGSIDASASKFVVNLASLKSDRNMRDNFLRRNVLQTDQYPEAVFVPKTISGLPSPLPTTGEVSFQLTGDLTIRDVTRPVTWDITGTLDGDQASGLATTTFTFADFNLDQPRVPVVLSIEDHITLEIDATVQLASP